MISLRSLQVDSISPGSVAVRWSHKGVYHLDNVPEREKKARNLSTAQSCALALLISPIKVMELDTVVSQLRIVAILFIFIAVYSAYRTYESWRRLSHIPGPPSTGISSLWVLIHTLRRRRYMALYEASQQHGPLIRIAPNHLACGDPDEIKRIWGVRSPYIRGAIYHASRFDPSSENIVSECNDARHNELRAKTAAGFSGKDIDNLEQTVDSVVVKLLDLINRKYVDKGTNRTPMDIAVLAQYFTLDVVSTLGWGKSFGNLEADRDVYGYVAMLSNGMPNMMVLCLFPGLLKILQSPLTRWFMDRDQEVVGFGKFVSMADKIVRDRLQLKNDGARDMLGSFLSHGLAADEAQSTLLVAMVAGSDTSATAIRATMLHIIASPVAYRKVKAETKLAVQEGRVSYPVITTDEARQLPYLQAVIKEGLRMFPPAPHLLSSETPVEGDTICGQRVPGGTQIAVIMWALARDRRVFGDDADTFRPERWLEADETSLKKMNSCVDLFFKAGKWQCLGKDIAFMELNKALFEFFRRYDMALCNPSKPWNTSEAGVFIQSNLWVQVTASE
ncbi:benzoate 4-monooxygenase cytochrome p450 [Xylariaceae sp. AK1471]|nr:benzoate 4-monooxygenase cytochrome p450 [Xylariaceae sp. AK1471]